MEIDLLNALPLLILTAVCLLVLVMEAFDRSSGTMSLTTTLLGFAAAGLVSAFRHVPAGTGFGHMITFGGVGSYFSSLLCLSGFCSVLLSREFTRRTGTRIGELSLLVILAVLGMMLIAQAADLMIIFLGIELMSICLYILAGFRRTEMRSNEAALKYFLLGAFATGFLLYGIALIYGASGATSIDVIVRNYGALSSSPIFWIGATLMVVGLAFKVGAVPFHMWVPDVYDGAPTPITGFMASGAKAAAFSAFVVLFVNRFDSGEQLRNGLAFLAAASMVFGNILAVVQTSVKRMLAYSSIAHAGYLLVGVASGGPIATAGILFYLASYMVVAIGSFGVVSLFESNEREVVSYDDFQGLGRKKPFLAALMAVFMLSLAGIPPLGGFVGKYYMFLAAVNNGYTWLAIVGVLTSLISVYYYLHVVMAMYFQEESSAVEMRPAVATLLVLAFSALVTIQLGVFPSTLLAAINALI
jgi:NADH-quinone oxidoreductase subunit N